MSGDPERDGKARPTAPAGVLGGPGKRPESGSVGTGVEPGARPPKSAFAHTIAMPTAAPVPPLGADKLNVAQSSSDAEPLRDPSERPAPTPYKRERAQSAPAGTLPMPELSTPLGARSEQRMIAARPGMRADSGGVEVRGAEKVGAAKQPASNRPVPAAPPPSGAPPAMPAANATVPSPVPAPNRDDHSVPRLSLGVEKIPSGKPVPKLESTATSQPIQLSLNASDHVETSLRPEAREPSRSMLPWIVIAVVVILGGVVFAMTRGGDEPAADAAPDRVDAVPAAETVVPTPVTVADPAQAVAPAAPVVAPATPTPAPSVEAPKPAAPAKVAPVEKKPEAKAEDDEPEAKASPTKRKKRAKKSAKDPVLKVSPKDEESDLDKALKAAERMAEPDEDAPPEPAEPPSPD